MVFLAAGDRQAVIGQMSRIRRFLLRATVTGLTLTVAPPTPIGAQAAHAHDDHRVVTPRDWWRLGAFAAGTALVLPFDRRLANQFEQPSWHRRGVVVHGADGVRALGDPGALLLSVGSYAAGRLTHHDGLADAGLHATEAVLLSGAVTNLIKPFVGRARPYVAVGQDPLAFHPWSGRAGYAAFPSGHTTVAFAAAAVVSAEMSRSGYATQHPRVARAVAPVMFGVASLVGASRMYHDAHWASDVMAGAGIGTVTGLILVRRQHVGTRGRIDRWLLRRAD